LAALTGHLRRMSAAISARSGSQTNLL